MYSTATLQKDGETYRLDPELTDILATSRDYDELLWVWKGWRDVTGLAYKPLYVELVDKMNEAAQDNGMYELWQLIRVVSYVLI